MTAAPVRLRSDVRAISRAGGQILLVPAQRDARPVRLSPVAVEVLPMLLDGTSRDEIADRLHRRFPTAADVDVKLAALLERLGATGLLAGSVATARARWRVRLPNPDGIARRLAQVIAWFPPRLALAAVLAAVVAASVGLVLLLAGGLSFAALGSDLHPLAIAWVLAIHIPLHELAHAVGSRYVGVPIAEAGLERRFVLPTPFVATPLAYTLTGRARRLLIPAAGPLVDLLAAGAASWIALAAPDADVGSIARWLAVCLLVALFFNTNPWRASDGSRMIEAALDDDLAQRSALTRARDRLSPPVVVLAYRAIAVLHLAIFATLFVRMAVMS